MNGVLIGDPLDVKMFESTKWVLDEGFNNLDVSLSSAINSDD